MIITDEYCTEFCESDGNGKSILIKRSTINSEKMLDYLCIKDKGITFSYSHSIDFVSVLLHFAKSLPDKEYTVYIKGKISYNADALMTVTFSRAKGNTMSVDVSICLLNVGIYKPVVHYVVLASTNILAS